MSTNLIPELTKRISREKLYDLYITKNMTKAEVAKELGITLWSMSNLLKFYDLRKPKDVLVAKRQATCMEKYGVLDPSSLPSVQEKIRATNFKKYGAATFTATPEGKKRVRDTITERYGASNYNNAAKGRATKLERYGDPNFNNREKLKSTCLERYGVENPFQLTVTKEAKHASIIDKKDYSEVFSRVFTDRDAAIELLTSQPYSYHDLVKLFNASYYTVQAWATRLNVKDYIDPAFTGTSSYEDEIETLLHNLDISRVERNTKLLNGLEIDIYLPDCGVGIEFNGDYWHSDLFKDKNYHLNKSKLAEERGIRLIHIYEYEWLDPVTKAKIISMLNIATGNTGTKIYARNCEIKQISNAEARPFNDANHLQGHRNAQVTYGLFYKGELVQLMSFSKTRYNRNLKVENSWEIIRGCPGSNNIVVGGVSKLFKHFVQDCKPAQVFSYCDFNKFDGRGYEALGMRFIGYTGPDLTYIIKGKPVHRNPKMYRENSEACDYRLYGAGSKKYVVEFRVGSVNE